MEIKEWKMGEIMSKKILENMQAEEVWCDGCNREFEGEIKKGGANRVKIRQYGEIPVHSMAREDVYKKIADPDQIESASLYIDVDQIKYFRVAVSNIDEIQADKKEYEMFAKKASKALSNATDAFCAQLLKDVPKTQRVTVDALKVDNVQNIVLSAESILWKNNVPKTADLEMILPIDTEPTVLKAMIDSTKNVTAEYLTNGTIGKLLGLRVKSSNHCYEDSDYIYGCLRVRNEAMAFIEQISKTKALQVEEQLDTNELRGYVLYGGKVYEPKKVVAIRFKKAKISSTADGTDVILG